MGATKKRESFLAVSVALLAFGTTETQPGEAQAFADRLQVHGFLTQGYARSGDLPLLGMTEDGDVNYRSVALQFNYALSDKDNVVLQFMHRRLGESPMLVNDPDIAVDWAFYQRRTGRASLKIGRIPVPMGIYSDTRDVGELVPFYRAPANFYGEGFKTLDGASLGYNLALGRGWELDATAFVGGADYGSMAWIPAGQTMAPLAYTVRLETSYGGQLWLNTPLPGVRAGVSTFEFPIDGFERFFGQLDGRGYARRAALDASLDRFYFRGELRDVVLNRDIYSSSGYYAQAGVRLNEHFSVNAQTDYAGIDKKTLVTSAKYDHARDHAIGLNYTPVFGVVFKFEAHRNKGYNYDTFVNPAGPAAESDYFISSISVGF